VYCPFGSDYPAIFGIPNPCDQKECLGSTADGDLVFSMANDYCREYVAKYCSQVEPVVDESSPTAASYSQLAGPSGCDSLEVVCALVTDEKAQQICKESGYASYYPTEQPPEDTQIALKAKFYLLSDYPSCQPDFTSQVVHAYCSFLWGPRGLYRLLHQCLPDGFDGSAIHLRHFSYEMTADSGLDFCFQYGRVALVLQGNEEFSAQEMLSQLADHLEQDGGTCLEGLAEKYELEYKLDTGVTCASASELKDVCPFDFDETAPCLKAECTKRECCGLGVYDSPAPTLASPSGWLLSSLMTMVSLLALHVL
jgi:hypothetical protein